MRPEGARLPAAAALDERLPRTGAFSQPPRTARYVRAPKACDPARAVRHPEARSSTEVVRECSDRSGSTILASIGAPGQCQCQRAVGLISPADERHLQNGAGAELPSKALASSAEPRSNAPPAETPHAA